MIGAGHMERISIALFTAPGIAGRVSASLIDNLPDMLEYYITDEYEWYVDYQEDILTGGTNDSYKVIEAVSDKKDQGDWDYAIALTDLPVFEDEKPVVAEALRDKNVGFISLPGFGFTKMEKRVREAILQLVNEIYYGTSDSSREEAQEHIDSKDPQKYDALRNKGSRELIGGRLFERFSPLIRERPVEEDAGVPVRYTVKSRMSGMLRIISGMVFANEPWKMFPSFLKILIIAFTTGSYALVFPTLWKLSDEYSVVRLLLLMCAAILALVGWIIMAHQLWEKKDENNNKFIRKMNNASTFFTLLLTVLMYYALLFVLFLATTFMLVPPSGLETQLSRDIVIFDFLIIAWTAASISTLIGGLGSAFEDEQVVLDSTYGYRQRQRHEKIKKQREKEKEKEKAQREEYEGEDEDENN